MTAVTRIHADPDRTEPDNADLARGDEDGPVVDLTRFRSAAHLTPEQVEALGEELDDLRRRTVADLGERDREYIDGVVATQRRLELAGRALLFAGFLPPAWLAGTVALSLSKILDNMEIGHNVMHGQYDFLDREDYEGNRFEWDTACPAEQWRHTHNYEHHTFTNIIGKDRDVGYAIIRVSPEQRWTPANLGNPIYAAALAALFQYGVMLHGTEVEKLGRGKDAGDLVAQLREIGRKLGSQTLKDYVLFPALAGPGALFTLAGNATANLTRNVWAFTIIFCGHFPDGVATFTEEEAEGETRGGWYLRQLLGSANIEGSQVFDVLTGNLSYQIEHHLFP
ncbi:MAG: acyl-CoA desaturase, partial [Acidimicrobiales bacterium]|nr:acyl-CoA desaturase [Acidimicrobiales bacterium]